MTEWWSGLSLYENILYVIALVSSILFLIKFISLILVGDLDGADGGDDLGADGSVDAGLHLLSINGILGFFTIGAWTGIISYAKTQSTLFSSLSACVAGFLMMLLLAVMMKALLKLQEDGSLRIENTVGKSGKIYLTIPSQGQGFGKVNIIVNGQLREFNAMTNEADEIKTGQLVRVVDIVDDRVLVVERELED